MRRMHKFKKFKETQPLGEQVLFPEHEEDWAYELFLYTRGDSRNEFLFHLFDLIYKADPVNRQKLSIVYPVAVKMFYSWFFNKYPESFFRKYDFAKH